jgi:hypothetical protein
LHKRVLTLLGLAIGAVTIAACSEKLDAGASCPLLCPQQAISLRDTMIDAILVDTTVVGLPSIGSESYMMLSSHGDTIDTRAIIRFDTLPQTYQKSLTDSTIVHIDTAMLVTPIAHIDSLKRPKGPITIEAYNVDTVDADTVAAVLGSLFRPDRFLGSKTFAPESLKDTLQIPISTDSVLTRVLAGTALRVGLRLVTSQGYDLRIGTGAVSKTVSLRIRASTDTAATPVSVTPLSRTPLDKPFISGPLADYTIVVKGQTSNPATLLSVGGVPSRRSFFRFDLPSRIVDSTTIVRASLLLTQIPNRRVDAKDTIYLYPSAILASPVITDVATALGFLSPPGSFGLDSVAVVPGDSGVKSVEIVGLVRTWKLQPTRVSPRTLGLLSAVEGQLPAEVNFFSTRAPLGVRPRLRITYAPQTNYGLP